MLNLQLVLISFLATIMLYTAITSYRWHKLKRHITDAIDALNLWGVVNTRGLTHDAYKGITGFLDVHKYKHPFKGAGSAFLLMVMVAEILKERRAQEETTND